MNLANFQRSRFLASANFSKELILVRMKYFLRNQFNRRKLVTVQRSKYWIEIYWLNPRKNASKSISYFLPNRNKSNLYPSDVEKMQLYWCTGTTIKKSECWICYLISHFTSKQTHQQQSSARCPVWLPRYLFWVSIEFGWWSSASLFHCSLLEMCIQSHKYDNN